MRRGRALRHPDRSAPRLGLRFAVGTGHLCQIKFWLMHKHSGQVVQSAGHWDLLGYVRPPQCRAVEESQRAHLHPNGIGRQTTGHEVEMVVPQMLNPELVGRSPVECTELRHRADVGLLGAGRQIAHLIALSVMEVLLSWERLWQPLDHKTGRFHPATAVLLPHPLSPALPRQRFSAMIGYGTDKGVGGLARSAVFIPASCSFRMAKICSSV